MERLRFRIKFLRPVLALSLLTLILLSTVPASIMVVKSENLTPDELAQAFKKDGEYVKLWSKINYKGKKYRVYVYQSTGVGSEGGSLCWSEAKKSFWIVETNNKVFGFLVVGEDENGNGYLVVDEELERRIISLTMIYNALGHVLLIDDTTYNWVFNGKYNVIPNLLKVIAEVAGPEFTEVQNPRPTVELQRWVIVEGLKSGNYSSPESLKTSSKIIDFYNEVLAGIEGKYIKPLEWANKVNKFIRAGKVPEEGVLPKTLKDSLDFLSSIGEVAELSKDCIQFILESFWQAHVTQQYVNYFKEMASRISFKFPSFAAALQTFTYNEYYVTGMITEKILEFGVKKTYSEYRDSIKEALEKSNPYIAAVSLGLDIGYYVASFTGWDKIHSGFSEALDYAEAEFACEYLIKQLREEMEKEDFVDAEKIKLLLIAYKIQTSAAYHFYNECYGIGSTIVEKVGDWSWLEDYFDVNAIGNDLPTWKDKRDLYSECLKSVIPSESDSIRMASDKLDEFLALSRSFSHIETDVHVHDAILPIVGDIRVKAGGSLTLENVTLIYHLTEDNQYHIFVGKNSTLTIKNSEIRSDNPDFRYYIEVYGMFEMYNSTLKNLRNVQDYVSKYTGSHLFVPPFPEEFYNFGIILNSNSSAVIRNSNIARGNLLAINATVQLDNVTVVNDLCFLNTTTKIENSTILGMLAFESSPQLKFEKNIVKGYTYKGKIGVIYITGFGNGTIKNNVFEPTVYLTGQNYLLENNTFNNRLELTSYPFHSTAMIVELIRQSLHRGMWRFGANVNYKRISENALIKNNKIFVIGPSWAVSSSFKENEFISKIDHLDIFSSSFVNNIVLANSSSILVEGGEVSNNMFTGPKTYIWVHFIGRNSIISNNILMNASIEISGYKIFFSNNTILSYPPTRLFINNSTFTRNTITNLLPSIRECGVIVYGKNNTLSKNMIKDFTVGIRLGLKHAWNKSAEKFRVEENEITLCNTGIELIGAKESYIHNNLINNSMVGIHIIRNAENNLIENNTIVNCQRGISIGKAPNNTFTKNKLWNCSTPISFMRHLTAFEQNIDETNQIDGVPVKYIRKANNTIVENLNVSLLGAVSSSNLTLRNCTSVWGVILVNLKNSKIENVSTRSPLEGFICYALNNTVLKNCTSKKSSVGFLIEKSSNLNLTGCLSLKNQVSYKVNGEEVYANFYNCSTINSQNGFEFLDGSGTILGGNIVNCTEWYIVADTASPVFVHKVKTDNSVVSLNMSLYKIGVRKDFQFDENFLGDKVKYSLLSDVFKIEPTYESWYCTYLEFTFHYTPKKIENVSERSIAIYGKNLEEADWVKIQRRKDVGWPERKIIVPNQDLSKNEVTCHFFEKKRDIILVVGARPTLRVVNQTPTTIQGDIYYSSLSKAVEEANDGDTIIVCPGTYKEQIKTYLKYPYKDKERFKEYLEYILKAYSKFLRYSCVYIDKAVNITSTTKPEETVIEGGAGSLILIEINSTGIDGGVWVTPTLSNLTFKKGGIFIRNAIVDDPITLKNIVLKGYPFKIEDSSNFRILDSKFSGMEFEVKNAVNGTFKHNQFRASSVRVRDSSSLLFVNNYLNKSHLKFYSSKNCLIENNTLFDTNRVLESEKSTNITVKLNNFTRCIYGIVFEATNNSLIEGNNFIDCGYYDAYKRFIRLYGLLLRDSSNNNTIFHNNFINSGRLDNSTVVNSWNSTLEGNYYDDYQGLDSNFDGVIDTPYQIPGSANAVDYYPLVDLWTPGNRRPIVNFTYYGMVEGKVFTEIPVVFNATKSYDVDGNITKYLWSFGDGTAAEGVVVNHTYTYPGNFTVKLEVVDDKDGKRTVSYPILVEKPYCILSINKGWNLLSFPVLPEEEDIRKVLPVSELMVTSIYEWNLAQKCFVKSQKIKPGVGYWVYSAGSNPYLKIEGKPLLNLTINLHKGWNLIGVPLLPQNVTITNENVQVIFYTWDNKKNLFVETESLEAGKAYWVYASEDCIITIGPS